MPKKARRAKQEDFRWTKSLMHDRLRMCRLKRCGKQQCYESSRCKIVRKIGELYTTKIDAKKARREKKEKFRRTKKFMGERLQMCYLKKLGRQQYYSRPKEPIQQDIKMLYPSQIETRQILIGSTKLGSKIWIMKSKGA